MTEILAVVVVFGGLIFFHELGHFGVARAFGMGVSTFSLGFGPKILKKKVGKTEYALSLLPLGGYVALVGETEEAELPPGFTTEDSFSLRPAWQRLLVVLAGPVANMVLALVLCWITAFGWGETVLLPSIGEVQQEGPAARAGIQKGDRVLAIDGREVKTWQEMSDAISASGGAPLKMDLLRKAAPDDAGAVISVEATPVQSQRKTIFGETETAWLIGIRSSGAFETHRLSLGESFGAGFRQCWSMISLTWQGFVKLVERVVPADQVGGPIMIAQIIGQQADQGLAGLLGLAALISINLGILNLLPIPVLDGGTVVFCLLEILFRRPVSKKLVGYSMRIGIALLLALMLFATYNDVVRIFKG